MALQNTKESINETKAKLQELTMQANRLKDFTSEQDLGHIMCHLTTADSVVELCDMACDHGAGARTIVLEPFAAKFAAARAQEAFFEKLPAPVRHALFELLATEVSTLVNGPILAFVDKLGWNSADDVIGFFGGAGMANVVPIDTFQAVMSVFNHLLVHKGHELFGKNRATLPLALLVLDALAPAIQPVKALQDKATEWFALASLDTILQKHDANTANPVKLTNKTAAACAALDGIDEAVKKAERVQQQSEFQHFLQNVEPNADSDEAKDTTDTATLCWLSHKVMQDVCDKLKQFREACAERFFPWVEFVQVTTT